MFLLMFFSLIISNAWGLESGTMDDFKKRAKEALDKEDWPTLENLSLTRIEADKEDVAARVYLSYALAGQRKFDQAVSLLAALKKEEVNLSRSVRGIPNPLNKTAIIYRLNFHCFLLLQTYSD